MEFNATFLCSNVAEIVCFRHISLCHTTATAGFVNNLGKAIFWLFTWLWNILQQSRFLYIYILSSISTCIFPTIPHHKKPNTLCCERRSYWLLRIFVEFCVFASAKMMCQFMQMQCLPWLQPHHYWINLNEAALPMMLQSKDNDAALLKLNQ